MQYNMYDIDDYLISVFHHLLVFNSILFTEKNS